MLLRINKIKYQSHLTFLKHLLTSYITRCVIEQENEREKD